VTSDPTKYLVKINCVILSTDIQNNKQYILSTDKDSLKLPEYIIDKNSLSKIDISLVEYLKNNYIFVNELELLPQIITLHSKDLDSTEETLNCVYGFVVSKTSNINNCFWQSFNLAENQEHAGLILEVIQKLR
jgi:hypothetical protein